MCTNVCYTLRFSICLKNHSSNLVLTLFSCSYWEFYILGASVTFTCILRTHEVIQLAVNHCLIYSTMVQTSNLLTKRHLIQFALYYLYYILFCISFWYTLWSCIFFVMLIAFECRALGGWCMLLLSVLCSNWSPWPTVHDRCCIQ